MPRPRCLILTNSPAVLGQDTRAASGPNVERIKAGQSVSWRWPGWIYKYRKRKRRRCLQRQLPAKKTYEVEFCWSEKKGPVGRGYKLKSPTCKTVQFTYGKDKLVLKEVTSN